MGLVITRRPGEAFLMICSEIGPIKITVTSRDPRSNYIKLNIEAPQNVAIYREELLSQERRMEPHGRKQP
jgi:sRNA-binding carbon storage regulator CsrA